MVRMTFIPATTRASPMAPAAARHCPPLLRAPPARLPPGPPRCVCAPDHIVPAPPCGRPAPTMAMQPTGDRRHKPPSTPKPLTPRNPHLPTIIHTCEHYKNARAVVR